MQMLEEGGQLRTPLIPAFDPERGAPIALGTPEVQPDAIPAEPSVGETTSGRHDAGRLRFAARQVEAIGPLADVVRVTQPVRILPPDGVARIEGAAQPEPDVQVRALQQSELQRQSGQCRDLARKAHLEVKESLPVHRGLHAPQRTASRSALRARSPVESTIGST